MQERQTEGAAADDHEDTGPNKYACARSARPAAVPAAASCARVLIWLWPFAASCACFCFPLPHFPDAAAYLSHGPRTTRLSFSLQHAPRSPSLTLLGWCKVYRPTNRRWLQGPCQIHSCGPIQASRRTRPFPENEPDHRRLPDSAYHHWLPSAPTLQPTPVHPWLNINGFRSNNSLSCDDQVLSLA